LPKAGLAKIRISIFSWWRTKKNIHGGKQRRTSGISIGRYVITLVATLREKSLICSSSSMLLSEAASQRVQLSPGHLWAIRAFLNWKACYSVYRYTRNKNIEKKSSRFTAKFYSSTG